jgi:D-inositol-3-phosphate glycosyltransferase
VTYTYDGPSVFGYETDRPLRRAASICVHTSPIASIGQRDAGGMNVYVRELACELAKQSLPVDIFTRRTDPDSPECIEVCPGVNVINITAGPLEHLSKNDLFPYLGDFAAQAALYSLREGVRYDIIHAHYWLSGWTAHLLKRYWDAPHLLMFHTTAHMKNAVAATADRETPLRLDIERRLIDLADGLVAANPDERADLVWRQHLPTDKVCAVPPGVDLNVFTPGDKAESRRLLGLPEDINVVLFVGRIDPIKGIDTLLNAIAKLPDTGSDALTVLVGGDLDEHGEPIGPLGRVAEDARAAGICERIVFAGSVPHHDLPVYYRAADVVTVPSRYESFGLTAVEAMGCGTPVVASRAGGLRFTIDEEVSGLLVPHSNPDALANALHRVLADKDLQARLGEGALEAAGRFAWPTVAASILHIYERLAEGYRANLCCDEEIFA